MMSVVKENYSSDKCMLVLSILVAFLQYYKHSFRGDIITISLNKLRKHVLKQHKNPVIGKRLRGGYAKILRKVLRDYFSEAFLYEEKKTGEVVFFLDRRKALERLEALTSGNAHFRK